MANGQKSEIIDLVDPDFKCEIIHNIPARQGCLGAIIHNQILICGGANFQKRGLNYFQDGFIIGNSNIHVKMLQKRFKSSSVVFHESTLWIIGGSNGLNSLYSTEFLSLNQPPFEGPDLPFCIHDHCVIQYDPNRIFLIGGMLNNSISEKTWIIDPRNGFCLRKGPTLNVARSGHSCTLMKFKDKNLIIVAGGTSHGSKYLDSVEILDPKSSEGWILGPTLPLKIYGSAMVPSPDESGVILLGGDKGRRSYSNEIYYLDFANKNWIRLDQTLKLPKEQFVALPISNEIKLKMI